MQDGQTIWLHVCIFLLSSRAILLHLLFFYIVIFQSYLSFFNDWDAESIKGEGGLTDLPKESILVFLSVQAVCEAAHDEILHNTQLML